MTLNNFNNVWNKINIIQSSLIEIWDKVICDVCLGTKCITSIEYYTAY